MDKKVLEVIRALSIKGLLFEPLALGGLQILFPDTDIDTDFMEKLQIEIDKIIQTSDGY